RGAGFCRAGFRAGLGRVPSVGSGRVRAGFVLVALPVGSRRAVLHVSAPAPWDGVEVAEADELEHGLADVFVLARDALLDRGHAPRLGPLLRPPRQAFHERGRHPPLAFLGFRAPLEPERDRMLRIAEVEGDRADAPIVAVPLVPGGAVLAAEELDG